MSDHIKEMLNAAGERRSITWEEAQEIKRNVEELEAHYREAMLEARTSLRIDASGTALNILEEALENHMPRAKLRRVGELDQAFRDLAAGEISVGRMREILKLWLAGMSWHLPSDQEHSP